MKELLNKRSLMTLILLLFIVLLAFLGFNGYSNLQQNKKIYEANTLDTIEQRLSSLYFEINDFPQEASSDLLFLSRSSGVKRALDGSNDLSDLESDFLEFLRGNRAYYKLQYLDEKGNEKIRAQYDGNDYLVVESFQLRNEKGEDHFENPMKLDEGEVFISRIDLNFENGILENRGTDGSPEHVPIIRFATPVFDELGNKKGVIVSTLYTDYFLENIRSAQREGEDIFLIDQDGYYLVCPEEEMEFGFVFGEDYRFHNEYPNIAEKLVSNFERRPIDFEGSIFSLRHIYPASSSFELFGGSRKVFGEDPDSKYFWVLISISKKEIIDDTFKDFEKSYFYFLLSLSIIVLVIILLVFFLGFKVPKLKLRFPK